MNAVKLLVVVGLLVLAASAQTPQPINTESDAPSVSIVFTGQSGNMYQFRLANNSSRKLTAYGIHLVPPGIAKVDGIYQCGRSCGIAFDTGDNSAPLLDPGQSLEREFEVSAIDGGTVVLTAAIFDDESYEGEQGAAAFLLARLIGSQAEYDRIVPAAENIIFGAGNDEQKIVSLRRKLGDLSVNVNAEMISTFRRWFPGLEDCNHRYASTMKGTAIGEKTVLVDSADQLAHGTLPGNPTLTQWWDTMKQRLSHYGCRGCAAQAARPKSSTATQAAFHGCADNEIIFAAYPVDGGSEVEVADLDSDDMTDEDIPGTSSTASAGIPSIQRAPKRPVRTESNVQVAPSQELRDLLARADASGPMYYRAPNVSWAGPPSGQRVLWRYKSERPVPDFYIYTNFFRDVANIGDDAFHKEVEMGAKGNIHYGNEPPAGGLSDEELGIVREIALACNQKIIELWQKQEALLVPYRHYPVGFAVFSPPIPGTVQVAKEKTLTVQRAMQKLKVKLGAPSFAKLNGFVREIYGPIPGKVAAIPLSDDQLYNSFLIYIGMLSSAPAAQDELANRQEELQAIGIAGKEWDTLSDLAGKMWQGEEEASGIPLRGRHTTSQFVAGVAPVLSPAAAGQASVAEPMRPAVSLPTAAPGLQPQLAVSPGGVGVPTLSETQARINQFHQTTLECRAQLQAVLGTVTFNKLGKYIRQLYAPAARERFVAATPPSIAAK